MRKVFLVGLIAFFLLGLIVVTSGGMINGTDFNESKDDEEENSEPVSPVGPSAEEDLADFNESAEVEVNFTDSNENDGVNDTADIEDVNNSAIVNETAVVNETEINDLEKVLGGSGSSEIGGNYTFLPEDDPVDPEVNESEDFYWNREIVNVYFGSDERMNIRVKVPGNLKDISDKMDDVKNGKVKGGLSASASFAEELEDLENELKAKVKNKYSEARLENIGLIDSIEFRDLEFEDNISLGVEELAEERFVQSYAIDPSGMEFSNATVTLVARGVNLYKCKDWNFSLQECFGDWVLFKEGLVPGEEYGFILTPNDPGFGEEINITAASHLDENRSFISDIFSVVQYIDDIWSVGIFSGEYVRATFEQNMTNGNVINLFVRNVLGLNSFIEIYKKDGDVVLGSTPVINETRQYDVTLSGMEGYNDVFDIRVVNLEDGSAYLEFEYIHDAASLASFGGSFFEGFESGNLATNNWTTSGAGKAWVVGDAEATPRTGTEAIWTENTDGESVISTGIDTTGYQDIIFSFYYMTNSLDGGEYLEADWYNGTSWINVLSVSGSNAYTLSNTSLTGDANENSNFAIRFRCSSNVNNEDCDIDDITVSGVSAADTTFPTISIVYPVNGSTYIVNVSELNYTYVEVNPDSCWYSTDGGTTNSSEVAMGTNFTGVTSTEGSNTWTVYCNDTTGNENSSVVVFTKDTVVPNSVTGLADQSSDTTWIYWNWTNPGGDFNNTIIYLDSVNVLNTTDNFYNATGLIPNTNYTLTVHTRDVNGNINNTDVNSTALTDSNPGAVFSNATSATGTGTLNWSHTVASGDNRILIVGATGESASATVAADTCRATNVTYGGIGLTKIDGVDFDDSGADSCSSLWYMLSPIVGDANITVTYAGTVSESNAGGISLYNISQTAPVNSTTNFGTGITDITTSINTTIDDAMVVDVVASGNTGDFMTTQSNIERYDIGTSTASAAGSTKYVASVGITNMGWNHSTNRMTHVVAVFAPVAENSAPTHTAPLLNSSLGTNKTDENITCYNQSTADVDSDSVKNIFNWKLNGVSITTLNMPFEGGSNSTYTKDYSGYGNDGLVNGSTWNSTGGYDGKGAYEFDGVNDDIYNISDTVMNKTSGTIEVWAKPMNVSVPQIILWAGAAGENGYSDGDGQEMHLSIQHFNASLNQNGFTFFYGDSDGAGAVDTLIASPNYTYVYSGTITVDTWNHVVVTWDEDVETRMYLNGVLVDTDDTSSDPVYDTNLWSDQLILGSPDASQRYYNGTLDDVRVYNHVLGAEQISALYDNRTDLIVSQEFSTGEVWSCEITPNDITVDGTLLGSNNITMLTSDVTPPNSVTNLANQSSGYDWIYWNWTNPGGDFNNTIIYLDGVWKANTTDNFYNATGLTFGTNYTLTVHTRDVNDNINNTDVNDSAETLYDTIFPSVDFVSPTDSSGSFVTRKYVIINITASDSESGLKNITTKLYNSTLTISTRTTASSPQYDNFSISVDGVYFFNSTACDNAGNCNSTATRNVTVDTTNPSLSLDYPLNQSYTTNVSELNYTATDANLDSCWYSTDLGVTNATVTCGTDVTGLTSVEGSNTWRVYVNDSVGNVNSSSVTFSKDNINPLIDFVSPTTTTGNFSQSYVVANVTATDTNLDTIIVYLYNSTGLVNSSSTGTSLLYINFSGLPDETYYINATVNDSFGNSNSTGTRTIVLDTTVPSSIDFVSPSTATGNFSQDYAVINVTAVDTNLANITVYLYNSTGLVNSSTVESSPNFINFTGLSDGTYYTNATVTDGAGNTNSTGTRTITLDGVAPVVSILSPTAINYSVAGIDLNVSADGQVDTWWYSNDSGATNTTFSPNTTITGVEGSNTFIVYSNDSAGNVGSSSVTFTIDTTSPLIDFVSPTLATGNFSQTNILVNVTATDTNLDTITIYLYNSTGLVQSNTSSSSPLFVNFTGLIDGTYYFNATVNDSVGNSNSTGTRTIILDTAVPSSVDFVSPSTATGNFSQDYVVVNVTAVDTNLANITVYLYNSTGLVNSSTVESSPNFINFTGLSDGTYYTNATVTDGAGNTNSTGTRTITLDGVAPVVSILSPTAINYSVAGIDLNVSADGQVDTWWYSNDSGATNTTFSPNTTITGVEGSNTFIVYSNDSAGNVGSSSVTFTIDTTSPLIDFVSPTLATGNFSQTNILVNVTATDTNLDSIIIYLYNSTGLVQQNSSGTSPLFVNFTGLSDGTYYFNATVNDSVGNSNSTGTRTIVLDNAVPQIDFVSTTTATGSFLQSYIESNVTATDTNLDTITIYLYNSTGLSQSNTSSTSPLSVNFTGLSDGTYYLNASVNDTFGNLNSTETRTIILDNVAPNVTLVRPQNITYNTTINIPLNFTLVEVNPDVCFYSLNDGANVTVSGCLNTTINTSVGSNSLTLYVNDSSGQLDSDSVVFTTFGNTSLVSSFSKTPAEVLEDFILYANYTDSFGNPVLNATCSRNTTVGVHTTGVMSLSPIGDYKIRPSDSRMIYANSTLRVDFENITLDDNDINPHFSFITSYNGTPDDELRVYTRCDGGFGFDSEFLEVNYSISNISQEPASSRAIGFLANGSLISSGDNCTVLFESSGSNFSTGFWIIYDANTTLNANSSYSSTNYGSSWESTNQTSFVDMSFETPLYILDYNSSLEVYQTRLIHGAESVVEQIRVECNATNYISQSEDITKNITDSLAPVVQINSITPNPAAFGVDNVTISWSASDITLEFSEINVTYPNGSVLIESTDIPLILNTTQLSVLGTYGVSVFANDSAGLNSSTNETFVVNDLISPAVFDLIPVLGQTFNSTDQIEISVNVTDNLLIDTVYANVSFPNGTSQLLTLNNTVGDKYNISFTIPNSGLTGVYNITFIANDSLNNINNSEVTNFTAREATFPLIQFVTQTTATGNFSQSYIESNVTASDSNLDTITIYLYNSTGLVQSNTSSTSPLFVNFTGFSDGTYYLNASVNDTSGNLNSSETRTIVLDNVAPVITIDSPTAINYSAATIDLNVSVDSQIDTWWYANDSGVTNITFTPNTTITGVEGSNTFIIYVNDSSGNIGSSSVTFTIDTTNPLIDFVSPSTATGNFSQSYVIANVTASDSNLDTITTYLYNSTGLVQTNTSTTSPLFVNFTGLSDGTYYINATVNDSAGNSNSSETRIIVLDTTFPLSVTNLANQSLDKTWIYWNWTNPTSDFSEAIVFIDGVNVLNTTNNFYNATGLSTSTSYTITVHTKDFSNNINDTDVNSTAITLDQTPSTFLIIFNKTDTGETDLNQTLAETVDFMNITVNITDSDGLVGIPRIYWGNNYTTSVDLLRSGNLDENNNLVELLHWCDRTTDGYGACPRTVPGDLATTLMDSNAGNTTQQWNFIIDTGIVSSWKPFPFDETDEQFDTTNTIYSTNYRMMRNIAIPNDADQYHVDIKIQNGSIASAQPLNFWYCDVAFGNATFNFNFSHAQKSTVCTFVGSVTDGEQIKTNKFRIVIGGPLILGLNNLTGGSIIVEASQELEENKSWQINQMNATLNSENYSFYSDDSGATWTTVEDGDWIDAIDINYLYSVSDFAYKIESNDTTNSKQNSSIQIDNWGAAPNLAPTNPTILTPSTGQTVNGIFNITWLESTDPNGDNLTYNLTLHYSNGTFFQIINDTLTNGTANYLWNSSAVADGIYQIDLQACDTSSACSSDVDSSNFTVDSVAPTITIDSPTAINYSAATIDLNVSADSIIDTWWHTNDSGATNTTFTPNTTITGVEGSNTFIVYSNDSGGNIGSSSVIFTIDTTSPLIDFVSPTLATGNFSQTNILVNVTAVDTNLDSIIIYLYNSTGLVNSNTSSTSPLFVNFTDLSSGTYYINATANDSSGNSNSTSARTIVLDTTVPSSIEFVSPTLATGNFSQTSIQVNVTAVDINLANITVYLYNSTGLVNSSTAESSPNFINFTGLIDGTYYINATVTDDAGNTNSSVTRTIALDTVFPTATIVSPLNQFYANATQLINISSDGENVWYNWNGTNVTYTGALNVTFAEGVNVLYVYANDSVNLNITNVTFTIDTIAPTLEFISPTLASGAYQNATSFEVKVNVTDINFASTTINVYNDNGALVDSFGSALNPLDVVFSSFPEGIFFYNSTACDSAGNCNSTETRNITIDFSSPTGVIINPENGSFTNITYLNFTLNVSDNLGLDNATLYIYNSTGGLYNQTTVQFGGVLQSIIGIPVTLLEGIYTWFWQVFDLTGNNNVTNASSTIDTFTLDITIPLIDFVSPTTATGNFSQSYIEGNVTVSDSYLDSVVIYLYNSTGLVNSSSGSTSPLYVNFSGLVDGTYYLNATINDSAGNLNSTETRTITIDNVAPVVSILSPTAINYSVADIDLNVSADNPVDTWWYTNDSGATNTTFTPNTTITGIEGSNTFIIYANDSAGKTGNASVTFIIDTTVPVITNTTTTPVLPIYNNGSEQNVSVNFTSDEYPINVTFNLYNSTGSLVASQGPTLINNVSELPINYAIPNNLSDGVYFLNMTVNDSLGNSGESALGNFSVDSVFPSIVIVSPLNQSYDNATQLVNVTSDGGDVWYNWNGTNYTYTVAVNVVFDEGANILTVYANDSAGNLNITTVSFTIDTTNPSVTGLIPALNSNFDANSSIEISANFTDSISVDTIIANITFPNGTMQQLTLANAVGDKYNSSFAIPFVGGRYNITFVGNDSVGNVNDSETTYFEVIRIVLDNFDGLNTSLGIVEGINSSNLLEIEYFELNFSVNSADAIDSWYLNFTANGTNGCSLGNIQNDVCYSYPNWIQFINGSVTSTFDGGDGNLGDSISVAQAGSGNNINLSFRIDEHYNPNVFKWYDAMYNFSDVKFQDGASQRINGNNHIKVELNNTLIPVDADVYKLDFRVNASGSPTAPLEAFGCNSSYVSGSPHNFSGCTLMGELLPSEFNDETKFRAVFTKNLSNSVFGIHYILIHTEETNASNYYSIKTYNATASNYTTHWEYSTDSGDNWNNSEDGYETELNVNWFYSGADPTVFVYNLWVNTTEGIVQTLEGNIAWDIDATYNYPPAAAFEDPSQDEILKFPYNVIFSTSDPNVDNLNVSLYLYQEGTLNGTLITDMGQSNTSFSWNDSTVDGNYSLVVEACELGTSDLFCFNDTISITIDNSLPLVQFVNPVTSAGNFSQSYIEANVTASDTNLETIAIYLYNSTGLVQSNTSSTSPLFVNFTGLADGTYYLNASVNDSSSNLNSSETRTILLDNGVPAIDFVSPTTATGNFSQDYIFANVTVSDSNLDSVVVYLYNSTGLVNSSSGSGNFSVNFSGLSDGTYYLNASANDSSGNLNSTETRTIVLDNVVPTVAIVSPLNQFYGDSTGLINITSDGDNVWYNWEGTNVTYTGAVVDIFSEGVNTLTVYANDSAGNLNITSVSFTIDTTFPSINFVSTTTATGNFSQSYIEANVTASDVNLDTIIVYLYNSTGLVNSSLNSVNFSINFTGLVDGTYYLNASVNDSAGNSVKTGTRTIVLDTVFPTATILSPLSQSYDNATQLINISSDGGNVWYNWNGTNITYTAALNVVFDEGVNTMTVYANDSAGNLNVTIVSFIIDSTAPVVTLISPVNASSVTASTTVAFSYNVSDNSPVNNCSLIIDEVLESTDVTITKDVTQTFSVVLSNADYNWSVNCTDDVGNENFSNTENFTLSFVAPVTPSVSGGGSGGGGGGSSIEVVPSCSDDLECDRDQYCLDGECLDYECSFDSECDDTKTCWMHRCVKLFDMKIVEVDSLIVPGKPFGFTYFLKGVAAIHGDVVVKFWIEKDGEIVTEGSDTIYMADFEEKTESTELFLPAITVPGVYDLYAEVSYDSYFATARRTVEVTIDSEDIDAGFLTGRSVLNLGDVIKTNAYFLMLVLGILILFSIIYWERREIQRALVPEHKWIKRHKLSVGTFLFFVALSGVLFYADKAGVLALSSLNMSLVKCLYIGGLVAVLLVVLSRVRIRNMFGHFAKFIKSLFVKREVLHKAGLKVKRVKAKNIKEPKKKTVRHKLKRSLEPSIKKLKKKGYDTDSLSEKPEKIGQGRMKIMLEKWRKKGYDTDSLHKKPKKIKQGYMKTMLEKWRKKGYDTGSISERGFEKK